MSTNERSALVPGTNEFRGGLVFKAHRLLYHSTLDLREIKKKKRRQMKRRGEKSAFLKRWIVKFVPVPDTSSSASSATDTLSHKYGMALGNRRFTEIGRSRGTFMNTRVLQHARC